MRCTTAPAYNAESYAFFFHSACSPTLSHCHHRCSLASQPSYISRGRFPKQRTHSLENVKKGGPHIQMGSVIWETSTFHDSIPNDFFRNAEAISLLLVLLF